MSANLLLDLWWQRDFVVEYQHSGGTTGKFSLHDETSPHGLRLINFTGFQRKLINLHGCRLIENHASKSMKLLLTDCLQYSKYIEDLTSMRITIFCSEDTYTPLCIKERSTDDWNNKRGGCLCQLPWDLPSQCRI